MCLVQEDTVIQGTAVCHNQDNEVNEVVPMHGEVIAGGTPVSTFRPNHIVE